MTELETVWTGAHGGCDGDLLLLPAITEKRLGTEPDMRFPSKSHRKFRPADEVGAVAEATIACLKRQSCTIYEILDVSGFGYDSTNLALAKLREDGRLTQQREQTGPRHSWVMRYTLVQGTES